MLCKQPQHNRDVLRWHIIQFISHFRPFLIDPPQSLAAFHSFSASVALLSPFCLSLVLSVSPFLLLLLSYCLLSVLICCLLLQLFLTLSPLLCSALVCLLTLSRPPRLCMSLSFSLPLPKKWDSCPGSLQEGHLMCYEWTDQTDPRRYCWCKFLARLPAHPATAEGGSKTNTHTCAHKLTQTEITFRYLSCTQADKYASHTDERTLFTDLSSLPGTDTQTQALTHSLPAALISRVFSVQLNLISRIWSWFTRSNVMRECTFQRH